MGRHMWSFFSPAVRYGLVSEQKAGSASVLRMSSAIKKGKWKQAAVRAATERDLFPRTEENAIVTSLFWGKWNMVFLCAIHLLLGTNTTKKIQNYWRQSIRICSSSRDAWSPWTKAGHLLHLLSIFFFESGCLSQNQKSLIWLIQSTRLVQRARVPGFSVQTYRQAGRPTALLHRLLGSELHSPCLLLLRRPSFFLLLWHSLTKSSLQEGRVGLSYSCTYSRYCRDF